MFFGQWGWKGLKKNTWVKSHQEIKCFLAFHASDSHYNLLKRQSHKFEDLNFWRQQLIREAHTRDAMKHFTINPGRSKNDGAAAHPWALWSDDLMLQTQEQEGRVWRKISEIRISISSFQHFTTVNIVFRVLTHVKITSVQMTALRAFFFCPKSILFEHSIKLQLSHF